MALYHAEQKRKTFRLIVISLFVLSISCLDAFGAFANSSGKTVGAFAEETPPETAHLLTRKTSRWTLDRLVAAALTSNPQIMAKRYAHSSALSDVDAAFWQFFPSPYSQVQAGGTNTYSSMEQNNSVTVGIQQPVWTGGRLMSGYKAAKAQARSADMSIDETGYTVALQTANAYQSFLQNRFRILAQRKDITRLEDFAEMMWRRTMHSISAEVDRKLIQSRLSQARSDLVSMLAVESSALARLQQLVGNKIKSEEIEEAPELPLPPKRFKDTEFNSNVMKHPILHRLEADVEYALFQADQLSSALRPSISLNAEYQNGIFSRSQVPEGGRVFLNISFAPGAGLSSLANIRSGKAKVQARRELYQAGKRDLISQMIAEYNDCNSAYVRLNASEVIVKTTGDVLESYKRMFVAGKRSWLDVLNAARELTQTELLMADAKALFIASEYRLRLHAGDMVWLHTGK